MIRSRHELKYLVSESQARAIAARIHPFMRPDHYSPNGCYDITSLYLDSPDLRLCRESLEGVKSRFKLRVRSYGDAPESPCFFEIKRRIDRVIVKSRAQVPGGTKASLLACRVLPAATACDNWDVLAQFQHYQRQVGAGPVMWIRYLRQAFESRFEDEVRVTFDRQLSFKAVASPDLDGCCWRRSTEPGVVLEIKFTRGYPLWVGRLIQEQELRQRSLSKYTRLIRQARHMRFPALTVPRGEFNDEALAVWAWR